ncbi:vacuolar protein sorting-associated protein IST1-like [Bidens hawaiensis]|uniref:vacuolar protein sorting-associated protein IST1-like n=1 Tax=Bidens hawaiensis TaxID=980011 RepID=UPI004049CA86
MGRKLDALLHRTSKLKTAINLAISRLAILKNHRHARFNVAHSDIIQLLRLNHHQQALLRVEQVIKDKNMLVVYDMIHDYCDFLKQRASIIEHATICPEELKEAVMSLLYAAPRCGEFPELKEIRAILTARFGKELVGSTIESRNYSGVNQKMIQKLSSKELSLENRTMILKGIAREAGIVLQLEATFLLDKVGNELNSEPVKSNLDMSDSSSRYDYKSANEEIIEEEESEGEDERSKDNINVEEFDDYSNDDNNIKSFEKMEFDGSKYKIEKEETGLASRTVYFSSYKQFPFRQQTNPEAGLAG